MMIKIRLASANHEYEKIEELAKIIWEEHYIPVIGKEQVIYMLAKYQSANAIKNQVSTGFLYYLVFIDEKAVCYFSYKREDIALFLSKIYVMKSARGKGIAKEVLRFIERKATEISVGQIYLTVNKENIKAISAYEKMGFEYVESLVMSIGHGFVMDDYKMEKKI